MTLIELAVTVAITGVLIVALVPAVSEARGRAISTACLANQHLLGVGYQQYTNDFNQLAGINYQEGTYWAKPWGQMYFYGGMQAWMASGPDFWENYLFGPNPTVSDLSGMGYTYQYVGGDGSAYYCPGTAASFESSWGGQPWYSTWTGEHTSGLYEFGVQGKGTITTYFYRGGLFEKNKDLPDTDPAWSFSWDNNWTWTTLSRPDSPWIANKPMLTCFWRGYNGVTLDNPLETTVPHSGKYANLLYTDGTARSWTLPEGVLPVWGWFGVMQFGPSGFDSNQFYQHMPWWFVIAERDNR